MIIDKQQRHWTKYGRNDLQRSLKVIKGQSSIDRIGVKEKL